ncbi:hypothetical protein Dsin_021724 [Dipteronia sinensis]|uniref:Uncharacterized protein n=1 Tax=Dipteronia sinensis TaxID=43782 RepID=A0AAE0DZD5_9ROSI|nr:hypothetical protein Dsin_021724 [Dipteronia sinensis]
MKEFENDIKKIEELSKNNIKHLEELSENDIKQELSDNDMLYRRVKNGRSVQHVVWSMQGSDGGSEIVGGGVGMCEETWDHESGTCVSRTGQVSVIK